MINKSHPDYKLYISEANDLRDNWVKEEKEASNKHKDFHGKDNPYGNIGHKYTEKLKKLQEKYSYLFTD